MDQESRMNGLHALLKEVYLKIEKLTKSKNDNSKQIAKLINDVYHGEYSKDAKYLASFLSVTDCHLFDDPNSFMNYLSVLNITALFLQLGVANRYKFRVVLQDGVKNIEIQQIYQKENTQELTQEQKNKSTDKYPDKKPHIDIDTLSNIFNDADNLDDSVKIVFGI